MFWEFQGTLAFQACDNGVCSLMVKAGLCGVRPTKTNVHACGPQTCAEPGLVNLGSVGDPRGDLSIPWRRLRNSDFLWMSAFGWIFI